SPGATSLSPGEASGEPAGAPEYGGFSLRRVDSCSPGLAGAAAAAHPAIHCPAPSAAPAPHPGSLGHVAWFGSGHSSLLALLAPRLRRGSAPRRPACSCRAQCRSPPNWLRSRLPPSRGRSASPRALCESGGWQRVPPEAGLSATVARLQQVGPEPSASSICVDKSSRSRESSQSQLTSPGANSRESWAPRRSGDIAVAERLLA